MGNQDRPLVKEIHSDITSTLEKLSKAGMTGEFFDRLRSDPEYLQDLVQFATCGRMLRPSIPAEQAEAILGPHFWAPMEWKERLAMPLSETQLMKAAWFPWDEEFLNSPCPFENHRQRKDTHFAFFGQPTSVRTDGKRTDLTIERFYDLTNTAENKLAAARANQPCDLDEVGVHGWPEWRREERCDSRWCLVYLGAARITAPRTTVCFTGQNNVLRPMGYEVVKMIEIATAELLHHIKNGEAHPGNWVARVKSCLLTRKQVSISSLQAVDGVNSYWISEADANLYDEVNGVGVQCLPPPPFDPATVKFSE